MAGGIAIHTQDPIKPAKGQAESPMAAARELPSSHARHASVPTAASYGYQSAPSRTQSTRSADKEPSSPRPGISSIPYGPMKGSNSALPPPPKAGEKAKPPAFYAPPPSPRGQAPQMSYNPSTPPVQRTPRGSVVSSSPPSPAIALPQHHRTTSMSNEPSLEHPPGYIQNPYASDMTPEQRYALLQEERGQQTRMSMELGYTPSRSRAGSSASPILDEAGEAWGSAKKWASHTGGKLAGQLGELHGKFWESVEGKK